MSTSPARQVARESIALDWQLEDGFRVTGKMGGFAPLTGSGQARLVGNCTSVWAERAGLPVRPVELKLIPLPLVFKLSM